LIIAGGFGGLNWSYCVEGGGGGGHKTLVQWW